LCKGASALPFVINDGINSLDVSLSIGVAQRQSGDKDLESLIAKADVNLFRAKREGCNRFVSDNQLGPVSRSSESHGSRS
ncbi:GGDEF domain-containing protein, partial [Cobetia marina]